MPRFDYSKKKVLITGAGGYLGGRLAAQLALLGADLVLWSNSLDPALTPEGTHLIRGPLQDQSLWETALEGVDIIFHLAAQTGVKVAEADMAKDLEANYLPVEALGSACRRKGFRPFVVLAGTATQYGITDVLPVDETFPDDPLTAYDLHKCLAERALLYFVRTGSLEGTCLRLSNIYGPGPSSSSTERGILNIMIQTALRGNPLTVFGTGDYFRDYIFIDDAIRALLLLPEYQCSTSGQVFLLSTGVPTTLRQAAGMVSASVQKISGHAVEVLSSPLPANWTALDERKFTGCSKKLFEACGWQPAVSFEEGVMRTVNFFSCLNKENGR